MSAFYKNYVELCAKKKKSLSAVAEDIGLSRTSPNGWKKGKQPSDVNIQKLAEYFGVSVEYLRGEENALQNEEKPTNQRIGELTDEELGIIEDLRRLAQADQDAILRMIRSLSSSGEK